MYDVRCAHCNGIYNVGDVEVTARYADCSVWSAPCCGRTVDDRGETGWKTTQDYYRLDQEESRRRDLMRAGKLPPFEYDEYGIRRRVRL
jgi:hypothetical protein